MVKEFAVRVGNTQTSNKLIYLKGCWDLEKSCTLELAMQDSGHKTVSKLHSIQSREPIAGLLWKIEKLAVSITTRSQLTGRRRTLAHAGALQN